MATPRLRPRKLSEPTIARLPVYQRIAESWTLRGLNRIDSQQIGELAGVTATTVRRDLAGLGSFGTRGAGYDVQVLNERIAEALGHDRQYDVIVVGIGNLGRALVNSTNFLIRGAQLAALYDNDPDVVGSMIAGHVVQSARAIRSSRPRSRSSACRPEAAQAVADRLVERRHPRLVELRPAGPQRADRHRRALRGLLDRTADPHVPPQQRHRTARWGTAALARHLDAHAAAGRAMRTESIRGT